MIICLIKFLEVCEDTNTRCLDIYEKTGQTLSQVCSSSKYYQKICKKSCGKCIGNKYPIIDIKNVKLLK